MIRGKSHIFNLIAAEPERPEREALPDNVSRFGLVEACGHILHVSRTNPSLARLKRPQPLDLLLHEAARGRPHLVDPAISFDLGFLQLGEQLPLWLKRPAELLPWLNARA